MFTNDVFFLQSLSAVYLRERRKYLLFSSMKRSILSALWQITRAEPANQQPPPTQHEQPPDPKENKRGHKRSISLGGEELRNLAMQSAPCKLQPPLEHDPDPKMKKIQHRQ